MTTDEFFNTWNNKPCDSDRAYGNQCADVADQYSKDVLGVILPLVNGAKDFWTKYPKDKFEAIANLSDNFPQKGDIVIWGDKVGAFGHVAIAVSADANHLTSFDQNWPAQFYIDKNGNQIGTGVCHYQAHNYFGVLGWLRFKTPSVQTTTSSTTYAILNDQTKYDFGGEIGTQELGAIRSIINDTRRDLKSCQSQPQTILANFSLSDLVKELLGRLKLG